jgi:hypothetical protein
MKSLRKRSDDQEELKGLRTRLEEAISQFMVRFICLRSQTQCNLTFLQVQSQIQVQKDAATLLSDADQGMYSLMI